MMLYNDPVYGEVEINEPVILDIINSPAIQRLKGIDQAWYFEPYFPGSSRSRFDHSMGVYLLLKIYWAPLEEQIAGIIHDISHGAFSHCLDYVFKEGDQKEQSHQDNIFETFIKQTDIPAILKRYDLDINRIIDDSNFPLKETTLPDLCADRIDYSLRDAWHHKAYSSQEISSILDHLIVQNGKRVFMDFASAKRYAELFQTMNTVYMAGIESASMFQTVGDYLKHAWEKWYIHADDFYTTDKEVLDKIAPHIESDEQLAIYWERMNNKIPCKNDPDDFDYHLFCKSRMVDPLFMDGEVLKRVSEVDKEWKTILEIKSAPKEYFLKFER